MQQIQRTCKSCFRFGQKKFNNLRLVCQAHWAMKLKMSSKNYFFKKKAIYVAQSGILCTHTFTLSRPKERSDKCDMWLSEKKKRDRDIIKECPKNRLVGETLVGQRGRHFRWSASRWDTRLLCWLGHSDDN